MKIAPQQLVTGGLCALLLTVALIALPACSTNQDSSTNLAQQASEEGTTVSLFSPTGKSSATSKSVITSALEKTVLLAEDELGLTVSFQTYTAEDYQDKTYDEVCLERARAGRDDIYQLNTDAIVTLGSEGVLTDLSQLDCVKNLRDVVKTANTVNGKLVAIPQELVAYGLYINKDIFDECNLELPDTPDEFIECCRVLKENGYETPIGANRWWLETFVFAQAYADLYGGGNVEAEVAALNAGETKYSDYMRGGFEFLQKLIDAGYIDAENAVVSEAFEGKGEGEDFMAGKCPITMAYMGAANSESSYGNPDFNLVVIGFPSDRGQMPVLSMNGYAVVENAPNKAAALEVMEVMLSDEALQLYSDTNHVISPSKNIRVDCIDALDPLVDKIEDEVYVLAANASMDVEQWGNVCLVVRDLLEGASVDECMAELDALQAEAIAAQ